MQPYKQILLKKLEKLQNKGLKFNIVLKEGKKTFLSSRNLFFMEP